MQIEKVIGEISYHSRRQDNKLYFTSTTILLRMKFMSDQLFYRFKLKKNSQE